MSTMESNLSEVAPATLQSLSVVGSFLEFWKSLKKNSLQYKKYLSLIVSQAYNSFRYVCVGGVISHLFLL